MLEKEKAEKFAHNAAVHTLRLNSELINHLEFEIQAEKSDVEYIDRLNALENKLKESRNAEISKQFQALEKELESVTDNEVKNILQAKIKRGEDLLKSHVDKTISDFTRKVGIINNELLSHANHESIRAKKRLKYLHEMNNQFAEDAGLAHLHTKEDVAFEKQLAALYTKCTTIFAKYNKLRFPATILGKIKGFQQGHKLINYVEKLGMRERLANELLKELQLLLFGGEKDDGKSKYNAPRYKGGSIEAYLDKLTFLHEYVTSTYPKLLKAVHN